MTIGEMKTIVTTQLEKMKAPQSVITMAVTGLPHLKRWKNEAPVA